MSDFEYGGQAPEAYDENGDLIVYYAIRPNKTRLKKEIGEVAKQAEELTQLTDEQIIKMQLPKLVEKAIIAAKKMSSTKPARKRQLKFITSHLKNIDLEHVTEYLNRIKTKSAHGVREHHQAEQWRDKLITSQGNDVLTDLLNQYPDADRQHLRQLQRNALKEIKEEKPPKTARILYKYLKDLISNA